MAVAFPSNPSGGQAIDLGQDGVRTDVLCGVSGGTICIWAQLRSLPTGPAGTAFNLGSYSRGTPTNARSNSARLEVESQVPNNMVGIAAALDSGAAAFLTGASGSFQINQPVFLAVVANYQSDIIIIYSNDTIGNAQAVAAVGNYGASLSSSLPPRSGAIGMEEDLTTTTENAPAIVEDFRIYNRALSVDELTTIAGCRGTDGIVLGLVTRYELLDQATGTIVPTGAVRDSGPSQFQTNGFNAPTYNGSLTTKFRRRLP
jgi:hypothetical protein